MTRIPDIDEKKLNAEQKRVYDQIVSGPRGKVEGPLRVWLNNPGLADIAQQLGAYCRYGTSLPQRLAELAILLAGAHWKSGYEWSYHAPIGIKAGLDPKVLDTIRRGEAPHFEHEDEQAVYDFVTELLNTRRVPPPVWDRALKVIGQAGLIDVVGIVGYYSMICYTINAFEVSVPKGTHDPFAGVT